MVKKIPPPPPLANNDPIFNRWLLELTSILNDAGGIDGTSIDGFDQLQADVDANSAAIQQTNLNLSSLAGQVSGGSTSIAALSLRVNILEAVALDLQTRMTAAEGNITTLQARPQVRFGSGAPVAGLGGVGDWYGNIVGAAGARVYIKTAVTTWTAFPF